MSILTMQEAAAALNYTSPEEMPEKVSSILLPAIDDYIRNATGKDWGNLTDTYTAVDPLAKAIAGVLLVRWFEDPGLIGKAYDAGVLSMIAQLGAKVSQKKQAGL